MSDVPPDEPGPVLLFGNDGASLTLTREQASEALAKLETEMHPLPPIRPEDAQGARGRLELLSSDPRWANALLRGNPDELAEFDRLVKMSAAGDDVGDAIAGIQEQTEPIFETTTNGQLPRRDFASAVAGLRDAGLNDASIAQAMSPTSVSLAEYRAAEALQSTLHADPLWRARLLSGDYQAKREWTLLSIILSSPIAGPK
jgi:hypothetical protein